MPMQLWSIILYCNPALGLQCLTLPSTPHNLLVVHVSYMTTPLLEVTVAREV